MKIIIVAREKKMSDFLHLSISPYTDEIVQVESAKECFEILNEDTDLVILDDRLVKEDLKNIQNEFINNYKQHLALFLVKDNSKIYTREELDAKNCKTLSKPFEVDELCNILSQPIPRFRNKLKFFSVNVSKLKEHNTGQYDLYRKATNNKYSLMVSKNDNEYKEKLSLLDKYSEHIFLSEEEYCDLLENLSSKIISLIKSAQEIRESITAQMKGEQFVLDSVKSVGISSSVTNLVDELKNSFINKFRADVNLIDILAQFKNTDSFMASHAILLGYLLSHFLKYTNLNNQATIEKLVMASIFHDATLVNEEDHIIRNKEDLIFLRKENKMNVLEHPVKVSKQLMDEVKIPIDVCKIILEHHERPSGDGFPNGKTFGSLHPLSKYFIMVEDIVVYLYKEGFNKKGLRYALKEFSKEYEVYSNDKLVLGITKMLKESIS